MHTDDLIDLIARDTLVHPATHHGQRALLWLTAGLALSLSLLWGLWGINPDFSRISELPAFWTKAAWLCGIALVGLWALTRWAHPGHSGWPALRWLLLPMGALGFAAMLQLGGSEAAAGLWWGTTWIACAPSIMLLGLPCLAALMLAMRHMAVVHPVPAGASAGLAAGGLAGLVYSLHCPELAFPFVLLWYSMGCLGLGLLGALAAPRWLRW